MINLNSREEIAALDKSNVLGSIEALPDQIRDAWDKLHNLELSESCKLSKNVVVSGMGGSALGGRIADSLMIDKARVPIEVSTEFRLPNYVNQDTLVILSSYSGNTEETLECAHEAEARGATIFGIATGGKLAEWLKERGLDALIYEPTFNPSNQPRMALGYSIMAVLAVLSKCGFINITDPEIDEIMTVAKDAVANFGIDRADNEAKVLAQSLYNKVPVFIASEHLVGVVHAVKNQTNENAKTLALLFDLPELNHHLMEGLGNPKSLKENLGFVFFESESYTRQVQTRYPITKEVIEKQDMTVFTHKLTSPRKLPQIVETLVFGSYVAFYLSMLYDIDPAPIPWVDYFKEKLG